MSGVAGENRAAGLGAPVGHCESRGRDGWQLRGLGGQMLVFKLRGMTRQRR